MFLKSEHFSTLDTLRSQSGRICEDLLYLQKRNRNLIINFAWPNGAVEVLTDWHLLWYNWLKVKTLMHVVLHVELYYKLIAWPCIFVKNAQQMLISSCFVKGSKGS